MAKSRERSTDRNLVDAERLLKEALGLDPNFFIAYCTLASVHDQIYLAGLDHTPARLALARTAIDAALRLRPDSGEGSSRFG